MKESKYTKSRNKIIVAAILALAGVVSMQSVYAEEPVKSNVVNNKPAISFTTSTGSDEGSIVKPYMPARALDGDATTASSRWYSAGKGPERGIVVDLQGKYVISAWKTQCFTGYANQGIARDFRLEGTHDGVVWELLDSVTGNGNAVVSRSIQPVAVTQVRLVVSYGNQSNNLWTSIQELEVTGVKDESTSEQEGVSSHTLSLVELKNAIDGNNTVYNIETKLAKISFGKEALAAMLKAAPEDVKVTIQKVDNSTLPLKMLQTLGDNTVLMFSVQSTGKSMMPFSEAVHVSMPYQLKPGEDPRGLIVYAITPEGGLTILPSSGYDSKTKSVFFASKQFDKVVIHNNKMLFNDVPANVWYENAVVYVSARGIATGTDSGHFSPNGRLTRGQFMTMVMRAYQIPADEKPVDNFSDAGNTYYTGYLAAAKRMGITQGAGNNRFAPDAVITRQEMFTLLYNTLNSLHQLPGANNNKELNAFKDANQVASWATEAMTSFVKSGVITGSNNALLPMESTDRAQMAHVLYVLSNH